MLRKTTAAVVLAGALALGTASATSLGTFDDVTFAAGDVDLQPCTVADNAITLVPDIPTEGTAITDPLVDTTTALLGSIDIDLSAIDSTCIDDELLDVVMLSSSGVIDVINDVDPSAGGTLSIDLSTLTGVTIPDITAVTEVRAVLSD